jgi:hypothetical protein
MKKRKKGRRYSHTTAHRSSHPRTIEMEPEELVPYIHRAEKDVLPVIKELELSPGAAAFLLAQHVQILVTGDRRLSVESAFLPVNPMTPQGLGDVAAGIVKHPKTHLWQIWVMHDGPCAYFGAYHDPAAAQAGLEEIITLARKGATAADISTLYHQLMTQGDGEPQQLPMDMMVYLLDHLDRYRIPL